MSSCLHRYFDEIPRKGIFINTKVKGMLFSILSKVMPIPTTSIEGDKVLLNGGKIFCTNAGQSLYYTVNCKTKPPMPRLRAPILWSWSPPTRRGFKVGHIENKLGWHGSAIGPLYFQNCRVPAGNILASLLQGFLGFGVSGATHHICGMKDSTTNRAVHSGLFLPDDRADENPH